MDLEALRVFLAVVDAGSLLAAAERLKLPRSTLRRRLDDLEAHAGVRLLQRTAQGATLTPAGETLAAGGRRVLQEANALLASARDTHPEPVGRVRVVLPVGLPPQALFATFANTRLAHPQLGLDVRFVEDPLAALDTDFDIAFLFGAAAPNGPWITRVILRCVEHLVASPTYLAQRGRPESVDALADHALFVWRPPGADPCLLPIRGGAPVAVTPALITSDIHSIRQLAIAGQGIAYVPDALLPETDATGEPLEVVLPGMVGRESIVRVVVPEALARSPKVRALQEAVLSFLNE